MKHHSMIMSSLIQKAIFALVLVCVALSGCGPDAENLKKLDPKDSANWKSKKVTETSGDTSYIFEGDVKPPLQLNSDRNATLASTEDVNAALKSLYMPPVSETRSDRDYAANNRFWRGEYRWEDYPLGPLVIYRTIAEDKRDYKDYDAIWKIRIEEREQ